MRRTLESVHNFDIAPPAWRREYRTHVGDSRYPLAGHRDRLWARPAGTVLAIALGATAGALLHPLHSGVATLAATALTISVGLAGGLSHRAPG